MKVMVLLENVVPVYPVRLIGLGTPVEVVEGIFKGFIGEVTDNPWAEEKPFTVVVEAV